MAEHWHQLRREAAQEAAAARALSNSLESRLNLQASGLRMRLNEETGNFRPRTPPPLDPGMEPLPALGRHLDELLRQHGQQMDVQDFIDNRNPTAALGIVLRNKPPYLRSCATKAPPGLINMAESQEHLSRTPLTPSRLVLSAHPNHLEMSESASLIDRGEIAMNLPNTVSMSTVQVTPLRRVRKRPGQQNEDRKPQNETLQHWTIKILRTRITEGSDDLPHGAPLLAAIWHLSKNDASAWEAIMKAGGNEEDGEPVLPLLESLVEQCLVKEGSKLEQERHQRLHTNNSGTSSNADSSSKLNPGTAAAWMRWLRRNQVAPEEELSEALESLSTELDGPDMENETRASSFSTEAALAAAGAEFAETARQAEIHAAEWGILLRSIPEAVQPRIFHTLALKPTQAMVRSALEALSKLPVLHPAAGHIRAVLNGTSLITSNALKFKWGHMSLTMYPQLVEGLQRSLVTRAMLQEAVAMSQAIESNMVTRVAERVRQLVASCKDRTKMTQVPNKVWSVTSTPRPQQLPAPMAKAFVLIVEACEWVEKDVAFSVMLPAAMGIITALQAAIESLETLIHSSADGSTSRAHRLALVAATECLLHIHRCWVSELLQAIDERDRASDICPITDPAQHLLAVASGLEARLEDVHRSAIGAANAAELQLILGVVLGDANLSSWQSFRPPLILQSSAGPGLRVWSTQLWSLLEEGAEILSARMVTAICSTVLVQSLVALQRRYAPLSPSTMGWRGRFCGDMALMCATAFSLCHHVPLSTSPDVDSKGDTSAYGVREQRNPLISRAAWKEVSAICRRIAAISGLQSCSAGILTSRLVAMDRKKAVLGADDEEEPWSWLPASHVEKLLVLARKEHTTAQEIVSTLTARDGVAADESALWIEVSSHVSESCAAWEARLALLLRGELHDEIPGLPYTEEHLEARRVLLAASAQA